MNQDDIKTDVLPKKLNCYLAGPFFNPAQCRHIEKVERRLDAQRGIHTFSPRKVFVCKPDADKETRNNVFKGNVDGIHAADLVIALLDYQLPSNLTMNICKGTGEPDDGQAIGAQVAIPDSGTVWEMGHAYASCKPVLGLYLNPNVKLNLMLAQCCTWVIRSYEELEEWLEDLDLANYNLNSMGGVPWQGRII